MSTESKSESKTETPEFKAIEFNTRSIQRSFEAFSKEGLDIPYSISAPKDRLDKFKSKLKPDKGPLQIIINTMNRRQVVTYDSKTGKAVKKDVLTYNVDMHGKDFLGNDMWIRQHIEGKSIKPRFTTTTSLDPETGDHIPKKEYDGTEDEYYIFLDKDNSKRKQVIQDIINNCNGSIIDSIRFYGHFPNSIDGPSFRCNLYGFDQFINSSSENLETLGRKEGGPQGNFISYKDKDKDNKKPYLG
jgi:hypothetical protein